MNNISNLKDFKGENLFVELEKIYNQDEKSREKFVRQFIHTTNKRAFFTIDENGRIKRKTRNYLLTMSVFEEDDEKFLRYFYELIDFSEQDSLKEKSLSRIQNIDTADMKKNIIKLIINGKVEYAIKYLYELYKRDEKEFFKYISEIVLMDNMDFEKTIYIYSMKKYFEKYGYSLEIFYYVMSYIIKARFDLYEYENIQIVEGITKESLKERVKNSLEKYKNKNGLKVAGYLKVLEEETYENEKIYLSILNSRMNKIENTDNLEKLTDIEEKVFEILMK